MYEEFFGLRAKPFGVMPSTALFFHSSSHRRTLAWLEEQTLAGEPLMVLMGSAGAGKTTVLQVLLRNLSDRCAPALVVSTQLDDIELTRAVLFAFGANITGESLDGLCADLRNYLEDLRSRGRRGLVVVDEAQNLSASTLRYLMRFPELHGDVQEGPLQVIVSGQPALQTLLAEAAGTRGIEELPICWLEPMSTIDTGSYVRHRLRVAGTTDGPTFSADAIDRVQTATGGLPRLVNRLCHRVLMSASLDRTRDIDAVRVADVAAELHGELGDYALPCPSADGPPAGQADPILSLATPSAPPNVDLAVESGPARECELPSSPEPEKRLHHRREGRRLPNWAAAAAAALVTVSIGWLGYDRFSAQRVSRLHSAPPASGIAPAGRTDGVGATGLHPVEGRLPAKSPERPVPADAGVSPRSATGEVRALPAPPSQPMDARAAFGLAPSAEPNTAPPAEAPACSDAMKALGLCS
jgi:type II secretory pathway predicted ATPase ExeA